jgi:hypothetical protein
VEVRVLFGALEKAPQCGAFLLGSDAIGKELWFRDLGWFLEHAPSRQRHSASTVPSTVAPTGVRFAS